MDYRTCSLDGCEKMLWARGWCANHYARWRRHGSPDARLRGEIRDGCRVCPGCKVDKPVDQYQQATGRCKPCLALERKALRPHVSVMPPPVHCAICGNKFLPAQKNMYCCSPACALRRKKDLDAYYQAIDGNAGAKANWAKQNRLAVRNIEARRRARKVGSGSIDFSAESLAQRMAFFGNKCWMCGGKFEAVDHVKPLAENGPHMLSNLRPACTACNSSKGARWCGTAALSELIKN